MSRCDCPQTPDQGRRLWLTRAATLLSTATALSWFGSARAQDRPRAQDPQPPIEQPPQADLKHFIERAFEMRRQAADSGDQPYGAVIVKDNLIVGQAPSRVIVNQDPTAHAETEAIRDAARRLGSRNLSDCVMYSSSPPCPMCEAAAYWAQIARLYYGHNLVDAGAPRLIRC